MLLFIVIVLILLHRHHRYGYNPYWNYPHYRGYGPGYQGYFWNGYTWQPNYGAGSWYGANYGHPYGYHYRRPYGY